MENRFNRFRTTQSKGNRRRLSINCKGFTLIELSITLVIIGLLIGAVVVGRELIQASIIRSQVSQLANYRTAANTFKLKYGYFPGDIPSTTATAVGLAARSNANGDGIIKGYYGVSTVLGVSQSGEPVMFWRDLSDAKMIAESLSTASTARILVNTLTSIPGIKDYYPKASSGNGGFLYIWEGGPTVRWNDTNNDMSSYMTISAISATDASGTDSITSTPNMSPATAFAIDQKMDDGLPQAGVIQAFYLDDGIASNGLNGFATPHWAAGNGLNGANGPAGIGWNSATTAATPLTVDTCYDNGNSAGVTQYYSVVNTNLNCALSMKITQ